MRRSAPACRGRYAVSGSAAGSRTASAAPRHARAAAGGRTASARAVAVALSWLAPLVAVLASTSSALSSDSRPEGAAVASLPLRFEPNLGQLDARVRFATHARGTSLFLTYDGAVLACRGAAVTMRLVGRRERAQVVAEGRLPGVSSFFRGNDPARWVSGVPGFARVVDHDVLPGVDAVYHAQNGALEYDLVLAPGHGARVSLELAFDGADALHLGADGALEIHAGDVTFVQPRPRVFQASGDGERETAPATYRVTGPSTVAFELAPYDPSRPLRIDPVLAYATYLGGSGDDFAYGVAVDGEGSIYVTGMTSSPDFPQHKDAGAGAAPAAGTTDEAFVTKLNSTGTELVYSVLLGGSGVTSGRGVVVDADGAATLVGTTTSEDLPLVAPFQASLEGASDAFVAKVAADGASLVYATFLGGPGSESGYGVALDRTGAAYVVGSSTASGLPMPAGVAVAQAGFAGGGADVFIAKVTPGGSGLGARLAYATYLGGTADDEGRGIAVDDAGAAYVTGLTSSLDFPTLAAGDAAVPLQALLAGSTNAFVAKVAPDGSRFTYATYLGGSEIDEGHAIAVDHDGAAYVTGLATSPDFPLHDAFQSRLGSVTGGNNAFITKLAPSGTALVYGTFLGGSGADSGESIAVSTRGEAFVAGVAGSVDFPTVNAFQPGNLAAGVPGGTNAFVAELPASGGGADGDAAPTGPTFATYLGGSVGDSAEAIALGASGAIYVAGFTVSPDFPTVGALQPALGGPAAENAFVAVLGARTLTPDAGIARRRVDAGTGAAPDASDDAGEPGPADAGSGPLEARGGGCTCDVVPDAPSSSASLLLPLLTAALLLRPRRRERARRR